MRFMSTHAREDRPSRKGRVNKNCCGSFLAFAIGTFSPGRGSLDAAARSFFAVARVDESGLPVRLAIWQTSQSQVVRTSSDTACHLSGGVVQFTDPASIAAAFPVISPDFTFASSSGLSRAFPSAPCFASGLSLASCIFRSLRAQRRRSHTTSSIGTANLNL
jgi:hypothetical protein